MGEVVVPPPACPGGAAAEASVSLRQSLKRRKFDIVATADLSRRLDRHRQGTTASTQSEQPWRPIGYEVYPTMRDARARERVWKRNPRMRFFFVKRVLAGPPGSRIVPPTRAGR